MERARAPVDGADDEAAAVGQPGARGDDVGVMIIRVRAVPRVHVPQPHLRAVQGLRRQRGMARLLLACQGTVMSKAV